MKEWISKIPTQCQICDEPITNEFIDGRLREGPWALMCKDCHKVFGVGLGLGKGQKYQRLALDSNVYTKVEG